MTLSPGTLLETVFERSAVAMALLVESDEILLANASFSRFLGYEPGTLTGKRFSSLCEPPADGSQAEMRLKTSSGQLVAARVIVTRVSDPDSGACALVVVEDSRPQVAAEAERRKLDARLRQAQKMDAVGQLTGGIAHDFNNMLTVILANAELIASALGDDEGARADLEELRVAARRGTAMVRKLLGFSRRERLVLQPVNLSQLIREISPDLLHLLPDNVRLNLAVVPTPEIHADSNAVQQILVNLLTNARDAMPAGGVITVESAPARLDAEEPGRNDWEEPGDYVCLTVRDTGTGMNEATLARVFEPFFTTKPPGLGTGLGLSMIYGLVKQHAGFVSVESELNLGTTARVYFSKAAAGAPRPLIADESVAQGGNETILLVDDEEPVRRAARRVLERFGYRVLVASDGEEALGIIRARGPEIHLVISDVAMPKLSGRGLYDAARAGGAKMKFLFASGYTARDVAAGEIDPGLPFINKPWTLADFLRQVREVLDSR